MAMDRGYSPRCTEECHHTAIGRRSPPDPTDKHTADKGQVVAVGVKTGGSRVGGPELCVKDRW